MKYGQINALECVQKKAAKFANHMKLSVWENLAQSRKIARVCTLLKANIGERAWKCIGDRLKDHATWAGMIMIVKSGPGNKEQISVNNPL